MRQVVKRICCSVLIPAAAGGTAATVVCFLFVYFLGMAFPDVRQKKDVASRREHESSLIQHSHLYPPSVPVSSPLIKETSPLAASTSLVMKAALPADLPSFAPLVRQVIPSVVNISISHESRSRPKAGTGLLTKKTAAPEPGKKGNDASRTVQFPKKSKQWIHHKRHHHAMMRGVVRPVDDDMVGAGSGFIVDSSGIIVTNLHVVGGSSHVIVSLSDGRSLPAKILGADPMTDIAVIKVESSTPLPCVTWGESRNLEIGDWILVAGNPFGFGSSVAAGIVSAVGRDLGIGVLDDFIQLDAPINPGNSGGPAFNLHGQVVAVNAAIASPSDGSVGIGFGIPAEIVAPVVAEIEKMGHVEHGWLGVSLNDASLPIWVEDVDRNSAAWQAGLRRGDAILAMGDVPVHDARTVLRSVATAHPGTVFVFTIRRHGQVKTLSIKLGKRPLSDTD